MTAPDLFVLRFSDRKYLAMYRKTRTVEINRALIFDAEQAELVISLFDSDDRPVAVPVLNAFQESQL